MARTWLSVTVDLLGGRGEDLWPWPGRTFAVGPSHTFAELAEAINDAFARWDRAHLSMFTLANGRLIADEGTGTELAASADGLVADPLDIATAKVARTVSPGDEFMFVFDFGDGWTHRCVVGAEKVDPLDVLGISPDVPLPYWGWGSIPDQYGRRWADDDGQGPVPRRPGRPHPMLTHEWPDREQAPGLDPVELRVAIAEGDAERFIAAVSGRDIDDALHQVGAGIPLALEHQRARAEPLALSVINRLTQRGEEGDRVLAEDLLARLRGQPLPGRTLPIDLDELIMLREGGFDFADGGYIDLHTGGVHSDIETDPTTLGEDELIDVESDPDRWLGFDSTGSRDSWQDMAAFAERQRDRTLRARMEQAIEGKGAFRRFRDLVHDAGLADQWELYSTDRALGRAREFLADEGIRVG